MAKRREFRVIAILFFLLAVGGFFRFYNLGRVILWGDDPINHVRMAYQPLSFVLTHNNQTALSTLLTHFLLALGPVEFMARLGSAVFGIFTIFVMFALGKRFFSRTEGLIAGAFVAVSPFLIQFSQVSRAYALFTLLSLLSLHFFFKAFQTHHKRDWALFSLLIALAIYNHLLALLILPAYAVFLGIFWLRNRIDKERSKSGLSKYPPIRNFILWTSAALAVNLLLYALNPDVRDFLLGSLQRAILRPPDSKVSFLLIDSILKLQIGSLRPAFYYLTLVLVLIGAVASWKKYPRQILLSLLYIAVPYIIFIAIKPRESNYYSAYRFFIFILPVIFLLAARGITALGRLVSSLAPVKPAGKMSSRFGKAAAVVLTIFMAGGYFANFNDYYTLFWRLGSYHLEKGVAEYLEKNVKSDAMIYFDEFPLATSTMMVNPLTKDLRFDEAAWLVRDHLSPRPGRNDLLFFFLGWEEFKTFIGGRDVDLWAVLEMDIPSRDRLRQELPRCPDIQAAFPNGQVVLHFHRPGESAVEKLLKMTEILLALPVDQARHKIYHLLAAKAKLMIREAEDGYRELDAFRELQRSPSETLIPPRDLTYRLLDPLLGVNDALLLRLYQERLFFEIRFLLFFHGEKFLGEGKPDKASTAFLECLKWGNDRKADVLDKAPLLVDQFLRQGRTAEAADLCQKFLEIDTGRYALHITLAEIWAKEGKIDQAQIEYLKAFEPAVLSPAFAREIGREAESAIIWERDGEWRLVFRAQEKAVMSGSVISDRPVRGVKKFNFRENDNLEVRETELSFTVNPELGAAETICFRAPRSSALTIDLTINGRQDAQKIIILPGEKRPAQIPFSLKSGATS